MTAADHYRAVYTTLFRMNERHDLRRVRRAANFNETPREIIGADNLDRQEGATFSLARLSVLFAPFHDKPTSPKGQPDRV